MKKTALNILFIIVLNTFFLKKLKLEAGQSEIIKFIIDREKLSFYNQQLQWVAEPGEFEIMIGASSSDIRLKDSFELVQ
jgi:beta-glucosidase